MQDKDVATDFKRKVKDSVASVAGAGVTADDVKLQLSEGSVMVRVIIMPSEVDATEVASVFFSSNTLAQTVAVSISTMTSLESFSTGPVTATITQQPEVYTDSLQPRGRVAASSGFPQHTCARFGVLLAVSCAQIVSRRT